jgi:hypothetical protein
MTRSLTLLAAVLLAAPATAQQISTGTLVATTQQNQIGTEQGPIVENVPGLSLAGQPVSDVSLLLAPGEAEAAPAPPVSRTGERLEQPTSGLATVQQIN